MESTKGRQKDSDLTGSDADRRPWLVAWDWQSRALLLAELNERGFEMRAEPGIRAALRALMRERLAPPLLLVDSSGDPDATPARLRRLLAILDEDGSHPTLILLVSVFERATWEAAFTGAAYLLVRPQRVGEVAQVVERLWEA